MVPYNHHDASINYSNEGEKGNNDKSNVSISQSYYNTHKTINNTANEYSSLIDFVNNTLNHNSNNGSTEYIVNSNNNPDNNTITSTDNRPYYITLNKNDTRLTLNTVNRFSNEDVNESYNRFINESDNNSFNVTFYNELQEDNNGYVYNYIGNITKVSDTGNHMISKIHELYDSKEFIVNDSVRSDGNRYSIYSTTNDLMRLHWNDRKVEVDDERKVFINIFNRYFHKAINEIINNDPKSCTSDDFIKLFIDDNNRIMFTDTLLPQSILQKYANEDIYRRCSYIDANEYLTIRSKEYWYKSVNSSDPYININKNSLMTTLYRPGKSTVNNLSNNALVRTNCNSDGYVTVDTNKGSYNNLLSDYSQYGIKSVPIKDTVNSPITDSIRESELKTKRCAYIKLNNSPYKSSVNVMRLYSKRQCNSSHCFSCEHKCAGGGSCKYGKCCHRNANWFTELKTNNDCSNSVSSDIYCQYISYTDINGSTKYINPYSHSRILSDLGMKVYKHTITLPRWTHKGLYRHVEHRGHYNCEGHFVDEWNMNRDVIELDTNTVLNEYFKYKSNNYVSRSDISNSIYKPTITVYHKGGDNREVLEFDNDSDAQAQLGNIDKAIMVFYTFDLETALNTLKHQTRRIDRDDIDIVLYEGSCVEASTPGLYYKCVSNNTPFNENSFNYCKEVYNARTSILACNFFKLKSSIKSMDDRFRYVLMKYLIDNKEILNEELINEIKEVLINNPHLIRAYRLNKGYNEYLKNHVFNDTIVSDFYNIECPFAPPLIRVPNKILLPEEYYSDVNESNMKLIEDTNTGLKRIDLKSIDNTVYKSLVEAFGHITVRESYETLPRILLHNINDPYEVINSSNKLIEVDTVDMNQMNKNIEGFNGYKIIIDVNGVVKDNDMKLTNDKTLNTSISKSGMIYDFKIPVHMIHVNKNTNEGLLTVSYKDDNCRLLVFKNGYVNNSSITNKDLITTSIEDTRTSDYLNISRRVVRYGDGIRLPGCLLNRYETSMM